MANPYHHSLSSVKKFGGCVEDYLPLHDWFDASKEHLADFRHRALRHHTQGIFELERVFGHTITLSTGKQIPTRWVGEQHVQEDLGFIPSLADWLKHIHAEPWMNRSRKLSRELEAEEERSETATAPTEACVSGVLDKPEPGTAGALLAASSTGLR